MTHQPRAVMRLQKCKTQKHKGTVKREDSQIYLRKTEREFLR